MASLMSLPGLGEKEEFQWEICGFTHAIVKYMHIQKYAFSCGKKVYSGYINLICESETNKYCTHAQ